MSIQDEESGEPQAVVAVPQREVVNIDHAIAEWDAYQELTRRLLTRQDYQKIGDKDFKKKSAWRKYAKAFNISCAEVSREIVRAEDGYPLYARIVVRATEPTGRWQDADQECHVIEKCCVASSSRSCPKRHTHCLPDCDGRIHFSHPGDVPAVAFTRAKNRAISDLIGAGEVSFEEADVGDNRTPRPARRSPVPATEEAPPPPAPSQGQVLDSLTEAVSGAMMMSDNQRKGIRASLTDVFSKDEQAAVEWVQKVEPAAVSNLEVHLTPLTMDQASRLLTALNEMPRKKRTPRPGPSN